MTRQPGPKATYIRTGALEGFGPHAADLAIEPSHVPGEVRTYRRVVPDSPWRPMGTILATKAERLYGVPAQPDSSD